MKKRMLLILTVVLLITQIQLAAADNPEVEQVVVGLEHPWDVVMLPDGEMLVSERQGQLRRIVSGKLLASPVTGLPAVSAVGQGGLMGLALHPKFAQNRWLYFAYVAPVAGGLNTVVSRGKYQNGQLTKIERVFTPNKGVRGGRHFGGRLLFDRQGYLWISLGDRGQRKEAQQPGNHIGTLVKVTDKGQAIREQAGFAAGVFSYGHRNIQGLAMDAAGQVWAHEHGPRGGDEVNRPHFGGNFGWPVITHGREYYGPKIGDGITKKEGMEQPKHVWVPSIAPSGMTFVSSRHYPKWQGDILIGSLKFGELVRLRPLGQGFEEIRYLKGRIGRIRAVKTLSDGWIYLLSDRDDGGLYRLKLN